MNILDLFSGVGGFSLGLERAGMTTVAFCEADKKCRLVLKKHWPDIPIYKNVKDLNYEQLKKDGIVEDPASWRQQGVLDGNTKPRDVGASSPSGGEAIREPAKTIDLICGGFPCQPFSQAGKQGGFKDDRDLWPEYFRLIQEVRPAWVIGENVAGFIELGLKRTITDLESEGYDVQSFVIGAVSVGALHRRDRVWIIAHSERGGRRMHAGTLAEAKGEIQTGGKQFQPETEIGNSRARPENVADSGDKGRPFWALHSGRGGEKRPASDAIKRSPARIKSFGWWAIEPDVGRVAHGVPNRVDRLKQLGNAVVPQVVEIIGRAIMETKGE